MSETEKVDRPPERLALSVEEAAHLLGISRDLVYDLVAQRRLASVRLGRRVMVPKWALNAVLGDPGRADP